MLILFLFSQRRNWGNSPLRRGLGGLFSSRKDAEPACRQTGRKEIVPNSLRLPYFAACPAELRVRRGGFFFAQRRRGAKELWSARYDFPPRRTGFAAWRLCELFFFYSSKAYPPRQIFILAKTHRPVLRGGQAQRKTRLLKTFCIGKM